ncbi:MAG: SPOR domain-containing protein [Polyangiaceae bacterium]|jgi:cell division septation protein DedD|nr:SPOR domain-containing protein [Polyangiaceae bacterium]
MESGSLRNFDQIQEREPGSVGSRVGTLVLASLAGACLVFACIALWHRPSRSGDTKQDPLAELMQEGAAAASANPSRLGNEDVAFPNLLSDDPNPTTAMAAIRNGAAGGPAGAGAASVALPAGVSIAPPPAADRLPVVPLPAQHYLSMSPVVTEPRDSLTAMAQQVSTPTAKQVEPGQAGGYQLQVSSFRTDKRAEQFARELRKRGHRAYIEAALVPGKGTWHRVRIGPFKNRWDAMNYRKEFEKREHIVTFLVEPPDRNATARRLRIGD